MKSLRNIGKTIFLMYALFCIGLYFYQDKLIFNPHKLPEDYTFSSTNEVEIEVDKDIFLNALWIPSENSEGVILYLHGNRGSNRRCRAQAMNLANNNHDILMVDYRGYGKSDGEIRSEKQLFADVQKVYEYLKINYKEDQIVLVGYSLGSGMASWLAANNRPKQLVLIAPYVSFYDLKNRYLSFLVPDFLVKYPMDNSANLKNVKCPIMLFHGTRDGIIPYDSSEQLAKISPSNIELITLENETHRGAIFNGLFRRKFRELVK